MIVSGCIALCGHTVIAAGSTAAWLARIAGRSDAWTSLARPALLSTVGGTLGCDSLPLRRSTVSLAALTTGSKLAAFDIDLPRDIRPARDNPRFADFARYHGCEVKRHRPYRPRTKGKVERMVHYVKDNFLKARSFTGLAEINAVGRHWLGSVANVGGHATTQARPCDLLWEEKLTLSRTT